MLPYEEYLESFLSLQEPWWVYALAFILPLCVMLSIRETWCWFFKLNKVVNRLERLEKAIYTLAEGQIPAETKPKSESRKGPTEL